MTDRPPCPHCGARPTSLWFHLLDTGAAPTVPAGSCPVLFARRNRRVA